MNKIFPEEVEISILILLDQKYSLGYQLVFLWISFSFRPSIPPFCPITNRFCDKRKPAETSFLVGGRSIKTNLFILPKNHRKEIGVE